VRGGKEREKEEEKKWGTYERKGAEGSKRREREREKKGVSFLFPFSFFFLLLLFPQAKREVGNYFFFANKKKK
jgi:hypothetical protein